MVHGLLVIGPAPISHELSSIGAGSALRYEILEWIMEMGGCLPGEGAIYYMKAV